MEQTQLSIQQISRYGLVEKLNALIMAKRATSKERRKKKETNHTDDNGFSLFFSESDYKRSCLRKELRLLHLANNFLLGTPYKKVEARTSEENQLHNWDCGIIFSLIEKYYPGNSSKEDIISWIRTDDDD